MFFFIKDQMPPINKPIVLRLFDEWGGLNNEVEIIDATYDGKDFFTLLGRKIREAFVTGWRYQSSSCNIVA